MSRDLVIGMLIGFGGGVFATFGIIWINIVVRYWQRS